MIEPEGGNREVAPVCCVGNTPAPAPLCGAGATDRLPGDLAVRAELAQFNTEVLP